MDLDEIQKKVDDALADSSGYDESVAILEEMGMGNDAHGIAAAHHELDHQGVREAHEVEVVGSAA